MKELVQQDSELEAAIASFPDEVEAAIGVCAPLPRRADFSARLSGCTVELGVRLPPGYPGRTSLQLATMILRSSRDQLLEGAEEELRSRVSARLEEGQHPCGGSESHLVEFFKWFRDEVLPDYALDGKREGRGTTSATGEEAPLLLGGEEAGGGEGAVGAPPSASASASGGDQPTLSACKAAEGRRCKRMCLVVHHHDDKVDARGFMSDRVRGSLHKRPSFYWHLTRTCPEVSGFLSFGKPAVLLAEGPLDAVERLSEEVSKFRWWWGFQEKVLEATEPIMDLCAWRAFDGFAKIKTQDLCEVVARAGRPGLYDAIFAGTSLALRKRPTRFNGKAHGHTK